MLGVLIGKIGRSLESEYEDQASERHVPRNLNVDDFVDTQSIRVQSVSIGFNKQPATGSITSRSKPSGSTDFNTCENRIRDQGVGGSNPLAPIFGFSKIQPVSECLWNGL